jgi:hypothetical protein
MNNLLLAIVLIGVFCAACTPVFPEPVTISLSDYVVKEVCHSANSKTILIEINNTTMRDVEIEWKLSEEEGQAGWSYLVDGSAANLGGIISMRANSREEIILTVDPNGTIGEATGLIEFYDVENTSTALQTCSYSVTSMASYFDIRPQGTMSGNSSIASSSTTEYKITMVNEYSESIEVQWERVNESIQSSWMVSINPGCIPPSVIRGEITIPKDGSIDFGLVFYHNNTTGFGQSTVTFSIEGDRANSIKSQLIEHTVAP